jgi:hypothetical protein
MMMRLHALGLLRDEEKLALFKRRSARWGSKAEPGDDKWEPEKPRLLRRTIELLVSEGILPTEGIPRHLGFSALDVENICGLRENYFNTSTEVVELATLRSSRVGQQKPRKIVSDSGSVVSFLNFRKTGM